MTNSSSLKNPTRRTNQSFLCEPGSASRSRLKTERAVQPAHQGKERLELARQKLSQRHTRHLRIGQHTAGGKRLVSQPFRGGMVLRVSTRHTFQHCFVVEPAEPGRNRARHP